MKQQEYQISINPDGLVEVTAHGFKGRRCHDAIKIFEQVVGEVMSVQETSEFYEPDQDVNYNIHQGND